jgi:hypothetical protein
MLPRAGLSGKFARARTGNAQMGRHRLPYGPHLSKIRFGKK